MTILHRTFTPSMEGTKFLERIGLQISEMGVISESVSGSSFHRNDRTTRIPCDRLQDLSKRQ